METIDRENEFVKLNLVDGFLISGVKKGFFLKMYGYSYFTSAGIPTIEKIKVKVPPALIKKMRIENMGIISIVFFLLGAMAFGFGFLTGKDQDTGELEGPHIMTGTIVAVILIGLGILYLRSKSGRVKVLQTSVDGSLPMLLYASLDVEELKSLRELIKRLQQGIVELPSQSPPPPPPPLRVT